MTIEEHNKFYAMVCEKPLSDLKKGQGQIIDILKGKNGDPGLCDHVRTLQKAYKGLIAAVGVLLTILTIQGVSWAWDKLFS